MLAVPICCCLLVLLHCFKNHLSPAYSSQSAPEIKANSVKKMQDLFFCLVSGWVSICLYHVSHFVVCASDLTCESASPGGLHKGSNGERLLIEVSGNAADHANFSVHIPTVRRNCETTGSFSQTT